MAAEATVAQQKLHTVALKVQYRSIGQPLSIMYGHGIQVQISHVSLWSCTDMKTKDSGGSLQQDKRKNGSETSGLPPPTTTQVC